MTTRNNQSQNLQYPSNLLSQSSFAYGAPSSPTISLLSSSSSPSSSSSSPIQFITSNKMDSNMNKKSALSNISAAISKHQNLKQIPNSKLINLIMDNNGVACSIVKSNTNIYYNLKVDAATSKAIHYCDKCTNPDCKAIHKNLTKPVLLQNSSQTSTPMRIFLSPSSSQNNQKLSGANINFIFERRYPLANEANNTTGSLSPNHHSNHHPPPVGHHHNQRHIVIRPGTSEDGVPLPLSPQALHNAILQATQTEPNSQAHFSINLNRLNNQKNEPKQSQPQQQLQESVKTNSNDPFLLFPNLNLNSLRFKNTLFLDQVRLYLN
ncbi:unnamed protein product [Brachionus calyciflorus]|uniref:Uncharacterized protein n=1 Tax=Brachionus calyciflorus TaxID=104777 RepID=A0A814HVA4_9BILA|nr:unnamed protein product [Brachionus calyciflorus]